MTDQPSAPGAPGEVADLATEAGRRAAAARIPAPGYDRSRVEVGMVHFGVGGFHRAHQAMYTDRLLSDPATFEQARHWGICGVDVMPADQPKKRALAAQDHLYTLVRKHADGSTEPRLIGSLVDYLYAPDEPERVLETLADPRVRIVSLTITEGGYSFNQVTGEFDPATPAVAADLAPGAVPGSVFGLVTEALRRRRDRGIPAFTVMSCDNVPGNGDMARAMFGAFADLRHPGLGDWVRSQAPFPNSMVDRITPVTVPADVDHLRDSWGVADALPVVCEPFAQWVLQDDFGAGRPPWERAGARLVTDVRPYELMKLRLLNVSHQAMAYAGCLAGYRYAHEVAADGVFAEFLRAYMQREARPTLPEVPGVDLDEYIGTLLDRFANPAIRDTLARLAAFSSDRIPRWLVPVITENVAAGRPVDRSAAVVASWARYAQGTDEAGEAIEVVDALREERLAAAGRQGEDALAFVRNADLFGDLAGQAAFTVPYLAALDSFRRAGARATYGALNASR